MGRVVEESLNCSGSVLIVGTGALALSFAARLGVNGLPVGILGTWKDGLTAIQRDGARFVCQDGRELSAPVQASADPSMFRGAPLALVLVKAWQTPRAAAQLNECLAPGGLAVSLQNGLGNREALVAALGPARVGLGVTAAGATLLGPGLARSGGDGTITLESSPHAGMGLLAGLLAAAGFDVQYAANVDSLVWGKLVANSAINPLTALLRVPNGALLERPDARALMAELARETAAVAQALGVDLPYPDPLAFVEQLAQQTAANRSSMLQDVEHGRPTEIDAICGAVARLGEIARVPTPANRLVAQLVGALDPTATR